MEKWKPLSVALAGKGGVRDFIRRLIQILRCYGVSPAKLCAILDEYVEFVRAHGFNATFPVVATVAQHYPAIFRKYQAQGIEFAIHGYSHKDHRQLSPADLLRDLGAARQIFTQHGIAAHGFRAPYLRTNETTLEVLQQVAISYDSSQGLFWDVLQGKETPAYNYVLNFYGARPVNEYLSVPDFKGTLLCIPYSLPDDEALVYRLRLDTAQMTAMWEAMLHASYESGELLVIGLHPERFRLCREALHHTLTTASRLTPHVWGATLGEIAAWWRARLATTVVVTGSRATGFSISVTGPEDVTLLARAVDTEAPTTPWNHGYVRIMAPTCQVRAPVRPVIGVSPDCAPALVDLLRQQGYIVESGRDAAEYAYYFAASDFKVTQARPLLESLETTTRPLVRLGRWPAGAQSALCISGDIDALSVLDYIRRFFEN